ncbi:hypothetical protein SAMN04490203_0691 [Pseudomonas taetrolens]|uniref:Uncharacterized protein n=1 Tax=Pseudomonas taetrolens TaxID=47884 RepID=A0A1H4KGU1_PSETA|nr:hypothetical protein SAMN04490203_0691 [Pseudomonas taetrolens]SQF84888.1 Uncharacterised protein [Pseudomonas taetrolens]VEH46690.1 Uncharacterised protein [Pseudomonas taetrolens]
MRCRVDAARWIALVPLRLLTRAWASALLDTLLLPLSVLTVLGVGYQATGGL